MATGQPWAKPVDLPGFNQPCGLGIEFLCHILVVKMAEIAGQNKQQFFLHLRYNVINHGGDSLWRGLSNHQRQYLRASKVPADKRQLGLYPVFICVGGIMVSHQAAGYLITAQICIKW